MLEKYFYTGTVLIHNPKTHSNYNSPKIKSTHEIMEVVEVIDFYLIFA